MEKINPAHILIAIVLLCFATMTLVVLLVVTGHEKEVTVLVGVSSPILVTLVGLKVDLVRRRLSYQIDGVYVRMHEEVVAAKEDAARTKGLAQAVIKLTDPSLMSGEKREHNVTDQPELPHEDKE